MQTIVKWFLNFLLCRWWFGICNFLLMLRLLPMFGVSLCVKFQQMPWWLNPWFSQLLGKIFTVTFPVFASPLVIVLISCMPWFLFYLFAFLDWQWWSLSQLCLSLCVCQCVGFCHSLLMDSLSECWVKSSWTEQGYNMEQQTCLWLLWSLYSEGWKRRAVNRWIINDIILDNIAFFT